MANNQNKTIPHRGYLMLISHYDLKWWQVKDKEIPFDLDVGLEIIDNMADVDLNLLVIDCSDGLIYKTHPELTRHYKRTCKTRKTCWSTKH